jgi:hypothetical protein
MGQFYLRLVAAAVVPCLLIEPAAAAALATAVTPSAIGVTGVSASCFREQAIPAFLLYPLHALKGENTHLIFSRLMDPTGSLPFAPPHQEGLFRRLDNTAIANFGAPGRELYTRMDRLIRNMTYSQATTLEQFLIQLEGKWAPLTPITSIQSSQVISIFGHSSERESNALLHLLFFLGIGRSEFKQSVALLLGWSFFPDQFGSMIPPQAPALETWAKENLGKAPTLARHVYLRLALSETYLLSVSEGNVLESIAAAFQRVPPFLYAPPSAPTRQTAGDRGSTWTTVLAVLLGGFLTAGFGSLAYASNHGTDVAEWSVLGMMLGLSFGVAWLLRAVVIALGDRGTKAGREDGSVPNRPALLMSIVGAGLLLAPALARGFSLINKTGLNFPIDPEISQFAAHFAVGTGAMVLSGIAGLGLSLIALALPLMILKRGLNPSQRSGPRPPSSAIMHVLRAV